MYTVNFWPIVVSAAISFGIGALWYSPALFGREWMSLTKMTGDDMETAKKNGIWKAYLTQFAAILVTFFVMSFLVSVTNTSTAVDGASLAFIIWIGFVAADSAGALIWERKPFKLVLIDIVGTLISLVTGGAIIGSWR